MEESSGAPSVRSGVLVHAIKRNAKRRTSPVYPASVPRAAIAALLIFVPAIAAAEPASGVWLSETSELEIEDAKILVKCTEVKRRAECNVTTTWIVHNPTSSSITTGGAFYGSNEATLTLDGKNVRADGSVPPALDQLVDVNSGASPGLHSSRSPNAPRTGWSITVDAGARATLVQKGEAPPTRVSDRYGGSEFVFPAYFARHPFLGGKTHSSHEVDFRWLAYPMRGWAGAKKVHVEVRWPNDWDFHRPMLDGAPAFDLADEGSEKVSKVEADGSKIGTLQLDFKVLGTTFAHGGPFLGVGGQFDPGEVRLRVGYEVAGPSWLAYQVAAETNAKDRFQFALVAEASTPNIVFLFPGLGIGAGPIVGNGPKGAFGGARFQFTATWPFLSMVIPVDVLGPSLLTGTGTIVVGSMLAQISF